MKKYSKVFVISDLHIPYHHRSSFAFLKAVKEKDPASCDITCSMHARPIEKKIN